jgi:hypothetical protein
MNSRFAKSLVALAAAGALVIPAVAQADQGRDDPPQHIRAEHQRHHEIERHHEVELHHRGDDGADRDR